MSDSNFTFEFKKEIEIKAPPAAIWESILHEIGPALCGGDGKPQNLKLEPWPGGRWFRDLGNNVGHLWGHVQVIKPPTLLELYGPMMMSYAAINHVQYRVTQKGDVSLLTFIHRGLGEMTSEHREGVKIGWSRIMEAIKKGAEK